MSYPGWTFNVPTYKARVMTAIRRGSKYIVENRTDMIDEEARGDIQVLDISRQGHNNYKKYRLVNIYDQRSQGRQTNIRPARLTDWSKFINMNTVLCDDFNAYSPQWNP